MTDRPKDGLDAQEQAANTLYPRPAPLPERKGEFHTHNFAAAQVEQRAPELFAETGMSAAASSALANTFREIQNTTGLPDDLVAQIADGHMDNLLAGTRVSADPDADDLALDQQTARANAELREDFRTQYGAKDGEAILERTRRFVRQHPTLAKMLQARGLGSKPEIVRGIAAHVFSTGWK